MNGSPTIAIALLIVSVSCMDNPTQPSELQSTDALIRALEQRSATVMRMEKMPREQHCLSIGPVRLVVNSQDVLAFEYVSAEAANAAASRVSRDGGTIGGCSFQWLGPPRFYKKDRMIVLYVGTTQAVIEILNDVLGAQFAGR